MRHATAVLLTNGADRIGAADDALSTLQRQVEDHAAHINAEAERMGQLVREVAEIARTRRSWVSIPGSLRGVLSQMSDVCLDMATKAAEIMDSHGTVSVAELDTGGDEVDRLQQLLYQKPLSEPGVIDVDAAIDLTMAASCYERYADLAVAVAKHGALLAMGTPRN